VASVTEKRSTQRGRPRSADSEAVAADLLRVLDRRGYRECSMSELAAEAGLSARTLHRYFPTKADIVWASVDTSFAGLRERLGAARNDLPLVAVIRDAVIASFADTSDDDETLRLRLRLIGRTPELHVNGSIPFRHWRQAIVDFVAARTGALPTDLLPAVVGAAVQTSTMTALTWWATAPDAGDPGDAVTRALDALGVGFSATFVD
jgi:AcrR family transcriptional regulator